MTNPFRTLLATIKSDFRFIFHGEEESKGEPIHLAVDRNGQRYTTHAFAQDSDPWRGALILSPRMVDQLRADGLLPLTEVDVNDQVAA